MCRVCNKAYQTNYRENVTSQDPFKALLRITAVRLTKIKKSVALESITMRPSARRMVLSLSQSRWARWEVTGAGATLDVYELVGLNLRVPSRGEGKCWQVLKEEALVNERGGLPDLGLELV